MQAEVLKLDCEPMKFVCPDLGEVALDGIVNHKMQRYVCARWNSGACDFCRDSVAASKKQLDLLERNSQ